MVDLIYQDLKNVHGFLLQILYIINEESCVVSRITEAATNLARIQIFASLAIAHAPRILPTRSNSKRIN